MQTEYLTIKGTEVTANTEKLVTTTVNDRTITVFVDISVDAPEVENAASLLGNTILKNLTSAQTSTDILNAIQRSVHELSNALPSMLQSVSEILPTSIAAIIEDTDEIKIAATGKLTIYRVSGGKMFPIYMMLDREPVELTPNGEILNFDISIESTPKEDIFSIILVSDGMVDYVKNPKIISLLSKVAAPKAIIRKLHQYLEQNPPRSNATIAIMWEPKVLEAEGISTEATLSTLTLTSSTSQKEEAVERLKKTYTRETLKKLTQTLRDIRGEVIASGKKAQEKTQTRAKPKLISQRRRKTSTDISAFTAILIILILLCLAVCGGYYIYGIWKGHSSPPQTTEQTAQHQQTHQNGIGTPTTSPTQALPATSASSNQTSATQTHPQPAETTPTTTTSTTATQTQPTATTAGKPKEQPETVTVELSVITKPAGLRTSLVVDGSVMATTKAPGVLSAQIPAEKLVDTYVVAMFQGSICASLKLENPQQTTEVKLDCTYLTKDDPERPIVILTRPANIRIRVFRRADNKLLFSALAPTRIPVLGPNDEQIVIRAYIHDKQCAAVITTWGKAEKEKYLTLICTK